MRVCKRVFPYLLGIIIGIVFSIPILAADTYKYSMEVAVEDIDGSVRTYFPVLVHVPNSTLVTLGYLGATGLDSRVKEDAVDTNYSLTSTRLGFVVTDLAAYQRQGVNYFTGYSPENSDYDIIVGQDGYITVSDAATLELTDTFDIEFRGYIDTTSGADKDVIYKQEAFRIYIQAAGVIRVAILEAADVETVYAEATSVGSGEHTVRCTIYVDGNLEDTTALGGASVPGNANDYLIIRNDVMAWMEYLKITL